MDKKTCFVIMGFGKKMDYENARMVDLDEIYNKVIKELFDKDFTNYELIRADEIAGSSIIDISMYTLLMNADLVVADLTTLNPNAIYELGVRHALKPYSTIMMAERICKIPFDLNHSRFLKYNEIGESLDDIEAKMIKEQLKKFVEASEKNETDSPLYSYLPQITPPSITNNEYDEIVDKAKDKSENIAGLVEEAEEFKRKSQFNSAVPILEKLSTLLPNNAYVIQQWAFCTYKSKTPNETLALEKALDIMMKLCPKKSLDIETLGITGAIYKRLFRLNDNFDYLDEAIHYYKKGYIIQNDYYNGENYATCLLLKTKMDGLTVEELTCLRIMSKTVQKEIIEIIESSLNAGEVDPWVYATLSICYLCLGNEENHEKYKSEFCNRIDEEWQRQTYLETIEELLELI